MLCIFFFFKINDLITKIINKLILLQGQGLKLTKNISEASLSYLYELRK